MRFKSERRVFWLKVKPRGWCYLLRLVFEADDLQRLRALASRMIAN